jgi:hypothetical protein
MKRKRCNKFFSNSRKICRHSEFEKDSKKIFCKIGVATMMVVFQKINFRMKSLAFKRVAYEPKSIKGRNFKPVEKKRFRSRNYKKNLSGMEILPGLLG